MKKLHYMCSTKYLFEDWKYGGRYDFKTKAILDWYFGLCHYTCDITISSYYYIKPSNEFYRVYADNHSSNWFTFDTDNRLLGASKLGLLLVRYWNKLSKIKNYSKH